MGDFGPTKDKWVCPNDRELCLRAKLKTGWSVKTSSANSYGPRTSPLNEAETEAIVGVIRRAETLDRKEQERVGRLVERLDNMKKNAMGNGSTQCVLCADEFGILTASPLPCNDCKKAVCTKCGVDTFSAHKEPLWLCKICAETRETWKKSGAWFYRGLPKYILPGRKSESGRYGFRAPDGATRSPVKSYSSWLQSKAAKGGSDREYTDSSEDEFKCSRLSNKATVKKQYGDSVEGSDSPLNGAAAMSDSSSLGPSPSHLYASPLHSPRSPRDPGLPSDPTLLRSPLPDGYPSQTRERRGEERSPGHWYKAIPRAERAPHDHATSLRTNPRKDTQHSPTVRQRPQATASRNEDTEQQPRTSSPPQETSKESNRFNKKKKRKRFF